MRFTALILFILCGLSCRGQEIFTANADSASGIWQLNLRSTNEFFSFQKRYKILSNINNQYDPVEVKYEVQTFINEAGFSDSTLLSGFKRANESFVSPYYMPGEKELFYGVWRAQITGSKTHDDIKKSVAEGTRSLIQLGYKDLGRDFMPFITSLMEEQQLFNYDPGRTRGFSKSSAGIVTSIEILNALGSQNNMNNAGVCRDVHEMAREMLKTMNEVYFETIYPGMKFNFDDYLFLQSWTTNKSQHVDLSFINPLDNKDVYELDWGRVIERKDIRGYDNGRLFGNTFRIWQFNEKKNRTVPIDFKRTALGKILDENILPPSIYRKFNGIRDEDNYSDIRFVKPVGQYSNLSFSIGGYDPGQKYFLAGWNRSAGKKKITGFLSHSSVPVFQAVVQENTRNREYLYPQWEWQRATGLMFFPRYISSFETSRMRIAPNITADIYFDQQIEGFFMVNSFITRDSLLDKDENDVSFSGDANISLSNGFNIRYNTAGKHFGSILTLQARSTLLPRDVRLMSPNPFVIIPKLQLVTPAIDIISTNIISPGKKSKFDITGIFEFTNLKSVLFSGSLSGEFLLNQDKRVGFQAGVNHQLKGIDYFWYPAEREWLGIYFQGRGKLVSFNLLNIEKRISFSLSTSISIGR